MSFCFASKWISVTTATRAGQFCSVVLLLRDAHAQVCLSLTKGR